jgi:hypothetical protein
MRRMPDGPDRLLTHHFQPMPARTGGHGSAASSCVPGPASRRSPCRRAGQTAGLNGLDRAGRREAKTGGPLLSAHVHRRQRPATELGPGPKP